MKKICFILLALILITGCEATYTIDIDDNFNETLTVVPSNNNERTEINDSYYPYPAYYDSLFSENDDALEGYATSIFGIEESSEDEGIAPSSETVASVERYNIEFGNALVYSYKFGENYQDSNIALSSLREFDVANASSTSGFSRIYASDFSDIFYNHSNLTKLTVNVKTNKNVIAHNADLVNANVYTWVITKKNQNRNISISYTDDRYYTQIDNPSYTLDPVKDDSNNSNRNDDPNNDQKENKKDNKKNNNKQSNKKQSKLVLYILYSLFFTLIFVIIIFRLFKNNIKIKK